MSSRMRYDGSFDLSFLLDGETVSSAGDSTGACWVERSTGPGTSQGCRVDVGQVLERLPSGDLIAYDDWSDDSASPAANGPSGAFDGT